MVISGLGCWSTAVLVFVLLTIGCGPRSVWHIDRVRNQLHSTGTTVGAGRLAMESDRDETLRDWIGRNGAPDYLIVDSRSKLRVIYVAEDHLVSFERRRGESHASVQEPVPNFLLQYLSREDRSRIEHARAAARASGASPARPSIAPGGDASSSLTLPEEYLGETDGSYFPSKLKAAAPSNLSELATLAPAMPSRFRLVGCSGRGKWRRRYYAKAATDRGGLNSRVSILMIDGEEKKYVFPIRLLPGEHQLGFQIESTLGAACFVSFQESTVRVDAGKIYLVNARTSFLPFEDGTATTIELVPYESESP